MTARLVHAQARGHHAEVCEIELPVGTDQRTAGHLPGSEELGIVTPARG